MAVSKETFRVGGMDSEDDARAVEAELDEVEGVMGTEIDRESGEAEIRYDEDLLSGERVKETVREMGYEVA